MGMIRVAIRGFIAWGNAPGGSMVVILRLSLDGEVGQMEERTVAKRSLVCGGGNTCEGEEHQRKVGECTVGVLERGFELVEVGQVVIVGCMGGIE